MDRASFQTDYELALPTPYASITTGDFLVCDLPCVSPECVVCVKEDDDGDLFFICDNGTHYIDQNVDPDTHMLIGIRKAKPN